MRATDLVAPYKLDTPATYVSFVVSPSATIETASGLMFRDYVEIHSPDLEKPYTNAINKDKEGPPFWKCNKCGYGPNLSDVEICGRPLLKESTLPKCSGKRIL